jgi:hypothetical protein
MCLLSFFSDLPNWIIAASSVATAFIAYHVSKQNKIFKDSLEFDKESTMRSRRPLFEKFSEYHDHPQVFSFTIENTGQSAFRISIQPNSISISKQDVLRHDDMCSFSYDFSANGIGSAQEINIRGQINYIDGQGINYSQPFGIDHGLFSISPGGRREILRNPENKS